MNRIVARISKGGLFRQLAIALALLPGCASAPREPQLHWWKGNLHTHSLWTDGTDFPEMIAAWYRDHGYHFIAVTEHNMLQEGERWVDVNAPDTGWPPRNRSARAALPGYKESFGERVVESIEGERHLVRLRALSEYRQWFEQPNRFLFLLGEEITDRQGAHINAFNLATAIEPRDGANNQERIRNNLAAVAEQRGATGRNIVAIVNHPNYTWALKAPELAAIPDARLFEVYNGHKLVNNAGDSVHISTDRMWDEILTARHAAGALPIYGVATDDAHDYRSYGDTISRPGRGWVMIRAQALATGALLSALTRGDFYASTGVVLNDIRADAKELRVEIRQQPGASYRTTFIGTRRQGTVAEVLKEVDGATAVYTFTGDERYVRARIVSSEPQIDAIGGQQLGVQMAWTQPVFP